MAVGRLVGVRTREVEIGIGPILAAFHLGTLHVVIRLWPVGGVARGGVSDLRGMRSKFTLYAIAGRLADGMVLLLAIAVISVEPAYASPPLYATIALAGLLTVFHLFPRHIVINDEPLLTDDGRILTLFEGGRWRSWKTLMRARHAWLERHAGPNSGADGFPGNDSELSRLFHAGCWAKAHGDNDEYVAAFESILDRSDLTADVRAMILRSLCDLVIVECLNEYLTPAMKWSQKAHDILPSHPGTIATSGAILIEVGNMGSGIDVLAPLMALADDPLLRARSAAYIGKAHHGLDEYERARGYIDTASTILRDDPVVRRIREELSGDDTSLPPG